MYDAFTCPVLEAEAEVPCLTRRCRDDGRGGWRMPFIDWWERGRAPPRTGEDAPYPAGRALCAVRVHGFTTRVIPR